MPRALAVLLLCLAAIAPVQAQTYPTKPIRLVVPFPPGGINDVLARLVAQKLGDSLAQPVVIENRPGAGGTIGSAVVAKSAADGYTLLFGATSTAAISPNLYAKLAYDPARDFAPIVQIATVGSVLVTHPSLPATTIKEFLDLARARPGTLNFGSAGSGASQHMGGELLKSLAGLDLVHVPYKGGAPAMIDLIGGQIAFMIEPIPTALPQLKAGKVRALAVTTQRRYAGLPDVPALAEALPGYELVIWFGLFAPAATPPDIVARLNAETVKLLHSADAREKLAAQGADPVGDTPEAFAAHVQREIARWGAVVRQSGAKVD